MTEQKQKNVKVPLLKEELFKLQLQKKTGQLKSSAKIKQIKAEIARILCSGN